MANSQEAAPAGPVVIAGIDEAGRGPVIGPLVVAGVAVPDDAVLGVLGCRDSKRLTPANRERLDRRIRAVPDVRVAVRVIAPADLDAERAHHSLNAIELARFQDIARCLDAETTYVDAADVDAARFGAGIQPHVRDGCRIVSEHGADDRYPAVAAASIVAKVARDAAVADLGRRLEREIHRPLGSGYPSDPATQAFLAAWLDTFGDVPDGTRRSWATVQKLLAPRRATLAEFE